MGLFMNICEHMLENGKEYYDNEARKARIYGNLSDEQLDELNRNREKFNKGLSSCREIKRVLDEEKKQNH